MGNQTNDVEIYQTSSKKIWLWIVLIVVILIIGIGSAVYFLSKSKDDSQSNKTSPTPSTTSGAPIQSPDTQTLRTHLSDLTDSLNKEIASIDDDIKGSEDDQVPSDL